jgi:nitrile hydratase accessory protein
MTSMAQLDVDGEAAPPRSNGELVFAEPWESRAFGLCMTLYDQGVFTWDEFRDELIAAIGSWEKSAQPGECYSYYRCWLTALERVVVSKQVVTEAALEARAEELAARPAGHDHEHEHDHDHDHDH